MFVFGEELLPEEQVFGSNQEDLEDYLSFVKPYRKRTDLFVNDDKRNALSFWIWRFKQKYLGVV
jgi:hypothetical protein